MHFRVIVSVLLERAGNEYDGSNHVVTMGICLCLVNGLMRIKTV